VSLEAHALGLVEAGELVEHLAVQGGDEHAVVPAVGDRQPLIRGVDADLPGESQLARPVLLVADRPIASAQRALGACLGGQALHRRGDRDDVAFSGPRLGYAAGGVDEHERRPRPHGVGVPGHAAGIVEDGVLDAVARDGEADRAVIALVGELRRVHRDDVQHIGTAALQLAQLLHDVQAVHAAQRPEVQQHDPAAQV